MAQEINQKSKKWVGGGEKKKFNFYLKILFFLGGGGRGARGAVKSKDFLDLSKIAGLMKNKEHLTFEGLNKIRQIQSNMNSKRTTYI